MLNRGRLDLRRPDLAFRSLDHECVGPEMVGVSVRIQDRDDVGIEFVPDAPEHLARRGVIEPAVDQRDMELVVPNDPDVGSTRHVSDPVA